MRPAALFMFSKTKRLQISTITLKQFIVVSKWCILCKSSQQPDYCDGQCWKWRVSYCQKTVNFHTYCTLPIEILRYKRKHTKVPSSWLPEQAVNDRISVQQHFTFSADGCPCIGCGIYVLEWHLTPKHLLRVCFFCSSDVASVVPLRTGFGLHSESRNKIRYNYLAFLGHSCFFCNS